MQCRGENWGNVGRYDLILTSNELNYGLKWVLNYGAKLSKNCHHRRVGRQTDRHDRRGRFYNLFHCICCSIGTDNKYQGVSAVGMTWAPCARAVIGASERGLGATPSVQATGRIMGRRRRRRSVGVDGSAAAQVRAVPSPLHRHGARPGQPVVGGRSRCGVPGRRTESGRI